MITGTKKQRGSPLYGGMDPADLPRYTYSDAARATHVPVSTIAAWVRGMHYTRPGVRAAGFFPPVIQRPDKTDSRLSFNNLLEVHALRALRDVHEVKIRAVRQAMDAARRDLGIDRLLVHPQLRTTGGALFLDYYLQLVELSPSRQMAMRAILGQFLHRVEVDKKVGRTFFFPIPRFVLRDSRPILVSPSVSFGNAILGRIGVTTHAVASRLNAGESKSVIIADYGLTEDEFDEAILYEAAA